MKRLPIGIQTFSELIHKNYVYVDKTDIIHEIILGGKYYFISRPRRFGKSLLVSTLEDIFNGRRDLFKGLAIDSLPYDWKKYPVIMISFADIPSTDPEVLKKGVKNYLQHIAQRYDVTLNKEHTPEEMLRGLVIELAKTAQVVILIDEYDYSILRHVHDPASAYAIREVLKNIYGVIKGLDRYLHFVLLTGVSKFSQTSVFSGLNNLNDITLDRKFNTLLGYTHDEIITYFDTYLIEAARHNNCSVEQLLVRITEWYDGYVFSADKEAIKLYNPYSVLLFLSKQVFSNYWFATGTPTFLINLFKKYNYEVQDFEDAQATAAELGAFEVENISLKVLLFQTGYLTIRGYNQTTGVYSLTYPNKETVDSLFEYIFASMTNKSGTILSTIAAGLLHAFGECDFEKIRALLTQFFASVPYTIKIDQEKYYQTIFYVLLKVIGADIIVEQPTNIGRIDAIIQTKDTCFVIEMKINDTADVAIKQIRTRKYYQAYELLGKKIILMGIKFDTELNNISEFKYEDL